MDEDTLRGSPAQMSTDPTPTIESPTAGDDPCLDLDPAANQDDPVAAMSVIDRMTTVSASCRHAVRYPGCGHRQAGAATGCTGSRSGVVSC